MMFGHIHIEPERKLFQFFSILAFQAGYDRSTVSVLLEDLDRGAEIIMGYKASWKKLYPLAPYKVQRSLQRGIHMVLLL